MDDRMGGVRSQRISNRNARESHSCLRDVLSRTMPSVTIGQSTTDYTKLIGEPPMAVKTKPTKSTATTRTKPVVDFSFLAGGYDGYALHLSRNTRGK